MPTETVQEGEPQTQSLQPAGEAADTGRVEAPLTRTGAMAFGLVPRNFDEGWRMATAFAKSALVPKQYQGKPEDVLIAMQYGAEIGLPPMASLQSVAVINGKPGVYGDGFLGVIMSKPAYAKHLEYYELADGTRVKSPRQQDYANDETKAVSIFWRKGNSEPFVAEFSIGDAKRAKLWGKEGPWTNYPARQLKWRARGFAGRDGFAAELRGVKMAEELLDYPDEPIVDDETLRHEPPAEPVRRSEKPAGASSTDAAAAAQQAGDALTTALPPARDAATATAATTSPEKPALQKTTARATTTAAGRTPDSKGEPGAGPSVTTESMLIIETTWVTPKNTEPFAEIKATVRKEGQAPVAMIFVTRDQGVYQLAQSCEGTEQKFNMRWHGGKRQDGTACKLLEAITAAN